ncbi:OmpW/AlkL family protein [Phenylobacterium sp.]|uniref:OmpW/AlkL family protein n=1 Tax=Phenylobacterium sp. TaxID=1871053 RepID=UPI002FDB86F6
MKTAVALFAAGLALGTAGIAQAQDFEPKAAGVKMINLRVTSVDPEAGNPITTTGGAATGLRAEVNQDVMPTLGLTYFFTDNIAIEAIAGTTQHQVKAKGTGVNLDVHKTWVLPPVVSLQYHFAPAGKVSPYVGAGINYMIFYNGKDQNGFKLDIDDGFGLALQAGVDIATVGPWSANVDVKKVFFETDATDTKNGLKTKVELDPWVISAGVGYKF